MKARCHSLRVRLQRAVLVPLALGSLLVEGAVLAVSWISTSQAFDRLLLDEASAIAANVKVTEGQVTVDLSERAAAGSLFDHRDRLFFAVVGPGAAVVAGDSRLLPVNTGAALSAFGHQTIEGEGMRTVTLRRERPLPFSVTVAQPTAERTRWLSRLAGVALVPQILLVIGLAWWLRRSITDELAPLARLQHAVERRDTNELSPLNVGASSLEVTSLERALNDLMRRVTDSVSAQRQFAGNVAHELRTPLAGIRALAAYGLAHSEPAVWRAQLEAVAASETRASRLVEQLLALAYADEARDGLPLGAVQVDELVRETVLRYLPMADSQGVELGASGLDRPLTAWGHPAMIEGALGNLIHNALRHGLPRDGRAPTLTIDVTATAKEVCIAVSDNGPGIPAPERQSLLQRWSRRREQAPSEGSGLGLSIAARYAALMRGRLSLRDGPAGGLTAVLVLDVARP